VSHRRIVWTGDCMT